MSIKGNKGEWSEIYALFKIIGDKHICPGDENLNKIKGIIYPILKILRTESERNFEYLLDTNIVIISENNKELIRTSILDFSNKAKYLLEKIKQHDKGTFEIPKIEQFMKLNFCSSLKAKSSKKTDITIVIHDQRTNQTPTLGFSIKSQLGSPSTLLNAGRTTNFKYKVNLPLSENQIKEINDIDSKNKIKDRIQKIIDNEGKLEFDKTEKNIFSNNLILIDSLLPQILAEIVLLFYSSDLSKVSDLVQDIENSNPLKYDKSNNHQFYTYKIKRFLTDIALGMMPSKVWSGEYDATGGYLIVKEDGDVLCYHIFDKNQFENYLINNTKLETASSSKHNFGKLYKEEDKLFMNLNLQIRFIK
jgi:type II restriction enzyme